jgi:Telomerase activating protein Est1
MQRDYQTLIIHHPSFGKDVDSALWKQCFYRQIEEYRKSIRKTVQIIESSDNATSTNPMIEKAKSHLAKLNSAFSHFLSGSMTFFQETMLKVNICS